MGMALDPAVLEVLMVRWFARCSVPMAMVECDEFRAFTSYLNKQSDIWIPGCSNTVFGWIFRTRGEEEAHQKASVAKAISMVHIISDTWTSFSGHAIFGIALSFVGEDLKKHTILANLKQIYGPHDSANYSAMTLETIEQWGIKDNLGYTTMDNHIVNDKMTRTLSERKSSFYLVFYLLINTSKIVLEDKFQIEWDPKEHRLRCNAHIFNLAAKAFLFSIDDDDVTPENNLSTNLTVTELERQLWRKKGCLGKVYNFNKSINPSSEQKEKWLKLAGL